MLRVPAEDSGKRIDLYLSEFSSRNGLGLSRTSIQRLIREGKVTLNGKVKPHYKVRQGDEIRVLIEDKLQPQLAAESINLEIVYEDKDVAVINKPPGLVVHPGAGNPEHTMVNALLHHFRSLSDVNPLRPGIVHRLDKETSGLIVIAKSNTAHLALSRQFAAHSIKRKYIALVKGRVEFDEGVIEVPIGRHPFKRKSMAAGFGENTRYAKTAYRTLKRLDDSSILELTPFTGRTHQLRVHLAFLGHPILGDAKYGGKNGFSRLALHAQSIGFVHPATGKFMEFTSPLPPEFEGFLTDKAV